MCDPSTVLVSNKLLKYTIDTLSLDTRHQYEMFLHEFVEFTRFGKALIVNISPETVTRGMLNCISFVTVIRD